MKTLQNDLTTIEQSKILLELGVPKNSANHYYGKDGKIHYIDGAIPYSLLWETGCTPCWSVGRLMEIINICVPSDEELAFTYYDDMIDGLIERIKEERVDFSKLEE